MGCQLPMTANKPSLLEQHAQTLIMVIVIGLLSWVGMTLNGLQTTVAQMTAKIESLQSEVQYLRAMNSDRYTAEQAARDWQQNRRELDDIKDRLRKLETGL